MSLLRCVVLYAIAGAICIVFTLSILLSWALGQEFKTVPEEPQLFCMPLSHYEAIKQDMEELRRINFSLSQECK